MYEIPQQLQSQNSRLCIGLDPRVKPSDRLEFAKGIVEQTHDFALAYKPNIQFWHGTSKSEIRELTTYIHEFNIPIIADLKISDIGSTNQAALQNMYDLEFDYVTHSPFPGNIASTASEADDIGIGLITLVVMSNPEAAWMVESGMYLHWASEVEKYCSGAVIGTTNHVTSKVLQELSNIIRSKFILAPGLGSQGGSVGELRRLFENKVLFNVSRGISQSESPKNAAEKYYKDILSVD